MEQVFPIDMSAASSMKNSNLTKNSSSTESFKEGEIEKIIEPGRFSVVLEDGTKVQVSGSGELKVGNRVQVLSPSALKDVEASTGAVNASSTEMGGFQWSAFIPLGFGGEGATAKLEVFVEKKQKGSWKKGDTAVYFVFTVKTAKQGEMQWSIYLKGRQVMLQLFVQVKDNYKENLKNLIQEVEKSLKNHGFVVSGPTILLNRSFKTPAGFRLNVRG
jgi:hypothetical protein